MIKSTLIIFVATFILSGCGLNWNGSMPYPASGYPDGTTNNQYNLLDNYNHYNLHKSINRDLVRQLDNRR